MMPYNINSTAVYQMSYDARISFAQSKYNMVRFIYNTHNRQPIAGTLV